MQPLASKASVSLSDPSSPNGENTGDASDESALKNSNLLQRLKAVIAAAARVDISNDLCPETSVTNRHYCSLILNGLAVMRARTLGTTVERIYLTPNILRVGLPVGLRPGDEVEAVEMGPDDAMPTPVEVGKRRRRASASSVTSAADSADYRAAAAAATALAEAELAAAPNVKGRKRIVGGISGGNAAARRRASATKQAPGSAAAMEPPGMSRPPSIKRREVKPVHRINSLVSA